MPFEQTEIDAIKSALEKNDFNSVEETLKPLKELGLDFKTPKQLEEFKNNFQREIINQKTSEFALNLEKDIKELTGKEKADPSEKYYEYQKRVISDLKNDSEKYKTELEELKAKGNTSVNENERIKQLESLLTEKDKNHSKELKKLQDNYFNEKVSMSFEKELSSLEGKFKKDIPYKDDIIDSRKRKFFAEYKPKQTEDGFVWVNKEGKEAINEETYKPYTTGELVGGIFKDLIQEERKVNGTGSGEDKSGTSISVPGNFKNKVQLDEFLKEKGLLPGSKEFMELREKYGKDLTID